MKNKVAMKLQSNIKTKILKKTTSVTFASEFARFLFKAQFRNQILLVLIFFLNFGCGYFQKEITTEQRIAQFKKLKLKTSQPVEVLWSKQLIPRIKAENTPDLFYTLGVVQMFLRQSQLEIYKKISKGALSEMAGPVSLKVDRFLKSIDFDHAAKISFEKMSPESIQVLEHMANGMNDYLDQEKNKSSDLNIIGIQDQPWTALDLVRVHKLTSVDVNWMIFSQILGFKDLKLVDKIWSAKINEKDFFDDILKKIKSKSKSKTKSKSAQNPTHKIYDAQFSDPQFQSPSFPLDSEKNLFEVFQPFTKSGSNAFVVGGNKTKSKSALLSSDPHLGYTIPNIWLFVILDSPEYKTMGYIIPSFPVPVIGRNLDIAWGGTNLWGISTYPTLLTEDDEKQVTQTTVPIKVRLWPDTTVKTYKIGNNPVLKSIDFPEIGDKDIIFKWQGYEPSNELETFLKINKAKTFKEFHNAFESYSVAGMTFVYGDSLGNIGKVVAFRQPQVDQLKIVYEQKDFKNESLNSLTLPHEYNPETEFVVSANDFTKGLRQPMSLFHAPDDRKLRMQFLLNQKNEMSVEDVKRIQNDVFSQTALDLKNALVQFVQTKKWVNENDKKIFETLETWDGHYTKDSKGALVFEVFVAAWSKDLISELAFKSEWTKNQKTNIYDFLVKQFDYRTFLKHSLQELDYLDKSKFDIYMSKVNLAFDKYQNWGEFHKLDLRHPLGNLKLFKIPFSYYKGPWPGGNETLMKATHKLSIYNGKSTFGAQARWITDMSNINENYLVYLGGQDGYIKSKNINDLTQFWIENKYLKVPFERDEFLKSSVMNP